MKKEGENMSDKSRNIIILIVILAIICAFFVLKNVDENKKEIKITSGLVIEKNQSGKIHFITIETFGEDENELNKLSFEVLDEDLWSAIEKNKYYFLTYSIKERGSFVLEEIQENDTFGKIYEKILREEKEQIEEEEQVEEREKFTAIFPSTDRLDTSDLTLLDSVKVDIDNDNKEEIIELYTTAQRDKNGEMMWDDGQKWFLLVHDEDKEYILFDEYVQIGTLEFWVFTSKNDYHILTLQTGSAVLKLSDYTYDIERESFVKKDIFNPEFLNVIHGSTVR
ncbi:hypothetical protein [Sporanaerobacter acetigenes]|nr:hypothetical protein [Sporanaerobacter acetigenes]